MQNDQNVFYVELYMSRGQRMAIMAKEKMYANQTHLNLWMNGHFTKVMCV